MNSLRLKFHERIYSSVVLSVLVFDRSFAVDCVVSGRKSVVIFAIHDNTVHRKMVTLNVCEWLNVDAKAHYLRLWCASIKYRKSSAQQLSISLGLNWVLRTQQIFIYCACSFIFLFPLARFSLSNTPESRIIKDARLLRQHKPFIKMSISICF